MSLTIIKGKDLLDPSKLRLKMLVYALPGFGKTPFLGSACPNIGIAACETGHGRGTMSIAQLDPELVFPDNFTEMRAITQGIKAGTIFGNKTAYGIDSLSYMANSFIKDEALKVPRTKGNSEKRAMGVPELDDYGTMGSLTRTLLHEILKLDKDILVTATLKIKEPSEDEPGGVTLIGPDLPGAMFAGSAAMFDIVMCGRTRTYLKDPRDAKSKVSERYWLTYGDGNYLVKCRCNNKGVPLLDREEPYDDTKGIGTFPLLKEKILQRYTAGMN